MVKLTQEILDTNGSYLYWLLVDKPGEGLWEFGKALRRKLEEHGYRVHDRFLPKLYYPRGGSRSFLFSERPADRPCKGETDIDLSIGLGAHAAVLAIAKMHQVDTTEYRRAPDIIRKTLKGQRSR